MNRNEAIAAARVKRRDLSSALIDLEVAAQAPVGSGAWRGTMHLTLMRLGAAFEAHAIVADGEGGIIESVVEDAPRLSAAADHLRAEHREIKDGIAAVTSEVEAIGTPTSAGGSGRDSRVLARDLRCPLPAPPARIRLRLGGLRRGHRWRQLMCEDEEFGATCSGRDEASIERCLDRSGFGS